MNFLQHGHAKSGQGKELKRQRTKKNDAKNLVP